jgi:hypothetical protein
MHHDLVGVHDDPTAAAQVDAVEARDGGVGLVEHALRLDAQSPQMRLGVAGGEHQPVGDGRLHLHMEHA